MPGPGKQQLGCILDPLFSSSLSGELRGLGAGNKAIHFPGSLRRADPGVSSPGCLEAEGERAASPGGLGKHCHFLAVQEADPGALLPTWLPPGDLHERAGRPLLSLRCVVLICWLLPKAHLQPFIGLLVFPSPRQWTCLPASLGREHATQNHDRRRKNLRHQVQKPSGSSGPGDSPKPSACHRQGRKGL